MIKVPGQNLDPNELRAAIEKDSGFKAIRKFLGGEGIAAPGPANSVTHMYKVHDTSTDQDRVLILFVKGGKVVNFMLA